MQRAVGGEVRRLGCLIAVALLLGAWPLASNAQRADLADQIFNDPAAPVAGNPNGDVTIVAFLDYNCPYCRKSTPELDRFVASDSNVKVIYKDWPILSKSSIVDAKIALGAAYQGKYMEAHRALMAMQTRDASSEQLMAAMKGVGIDLAKLAADLNTHDADITALLRRNNAEAEAIGINGTPVFLIGQFKVSQGLDEAGFRQVVSDVRARQKNGKTIAQ